jgi:hypothetical protein
MNNKFFQYESKCIGLSSKFIYLLTIHSHLNVHHYTIDPHNLYLYCRNTVYPIIRKQGHINLINPATIVCLSQARI